MSKAVMTLCVVGVVAILFVTEMIPLAVTAMSGAIVIGLLGILPAGQVFSGLSDGTVVLFAGMFIIEASMFHCFYNSSRNTSKYACSWTWRL